MTLFRDLERLDVGHPMPTESSYQYLNRSGRPEASRVRALLEDVFSRYPDTDKHSLKGKFRSREETNHATAVLELLLHEIFLRERHEVLAVEPHMPGVSARPDFKIALNSTGQEVIVEAVLATGVPDENRSADQRVQIVLDALNREVSEHYFLAVSHRGAPRSNVSLKYVRRTLRAWIAELPSTLEDARSQRLPLSLDGLHLTVSVAAERPTNMGAPTRAIGATFMPAQWIDRFSAVRRALVGKASRYGSLDVPYIIAVNAVHPYASIREAIETLYGAAAVRIRTYQDGRIETSPTREHDGFWAFDGSRNPQVSAVLFLDRVNEWDVARRGVCLLHNPSAR